MHTQPFLAVVVMQVILAHECLVNASHLQAARDSKQAQQQLLQLLRGELRRCDRSSLAARRAQQGCVRLLCTR